MADSKFKIWCSRFTANYGMFYVLILIVAAFSIVTIRVQPAEGFTAGEMLAEDFLALHDTGTCALVASTSTDDERLVEGFKNTMGEQTNRLLVVAQADYPPQIKRVLIDALEAADAAPSVLICSRTANAYTFYQSIPALANIPKIVPIARNRSNFLKPSNLTNVPQKMARMSIIAIGMTMVIITAGIDLSVGSLMAVAAIASTLLIRRFGGEEASISSVILCFTAGIGLCGVLGAISGTLTTAFKMPAFIATLAMMLFARGMAKGMAENTTIIGMPRDIFQNLWEVTIPGTSTTLLTPVVIMIILYAGAHFMMTKTVLGRHIYAIGGNEEAARLSGVPVARVLLIVYTITGMLAGLAGIMMATEFKAGKPTWGIGDELNVITAVVVGGTSLMGGRGRILGTLIGCAIIVVISNGMNLIDLRDYYQNMVMAIVIVLAIVLDNAKKGAIPWLNFKRRQPATQKAENA